MDNSLQERWNKFIDPNRESQCSGILFDLLAKEPFRINYRNLNLKARQLQSFIDSVNLVITLNWAEPNSEYWEPSISILLRNGTILESEPGYYRMVIKESEDDYILHLVKDEDGEGNIQYHIIDISDILDIQLHR